jgi:hypothetical protein
MKIWRKSKDGGPESRVTGYWLIEIKWLFSIALLRFDNGTRDAYHNHAFNSISWLLRGQLEEVFLQGFFATDHLPSWRPIITLRRHFHRVESHGTSWVLTFRGPWARTWHEYIDGEHATLTHGRQVVR